VRLFLAINVEPAARRAVYAAAAPLRAAAPQLPWIDADRLHVTLKFIGEQPEATIPGWASAIDDVTKRHVRVQSSLRGFGAFPNFRRARVVFMCMDGDARLELLYHDVETAYHLAGCPLEGRAFRPHVTLARARQRLPDDVVRALRREAGRPGGQRVPVTVRSVDLMRSELRPGGSSYHLLHASLLREA
jgi:RNA 2',3'-cyclic 3'-phosphodiesterase